MGGSSKWTELSLSLENADREQSHVVKELCKERDAQVYCIIFLSTV